VCIASESMAAARTELGRIVAAITVEYSSLFHKISDEDREGEELISDVPGATPAQMSSGLCLGPAWRGLLLWAALLLSWEAVDRC